MSKFVWRIGDFFKFRGWNVCEEIEVRWSECVRDSCYILIRNKYIIIIDYWVWWIRLVVEFV